jgi:hypothetical protein
VKIAIPRLLIGGVAAVFSLYIIVLGLYSISVPFKPVPVIAALLLYAVATTLSLLPRGPARMPLWLAAFNLSVVVVISLVVTANLDPHPAGGNGYATWYVAGVGVLLTITATRRRYAFAWGGVAFLVLQTILWAGPTALVDLGVVGSVAWVGIAHLISTGMARATKDAHRFALADREATEWQALQEAHVHERQFRLGQTSSMALAMLRQIEQTGGNLSDEQRQECLHLEGAIRDEIRGRRLLNDAVRHEVMLARRRGSAVTLLDEGGLDDLPDAELERVHNALAAAISSTMADKIIARTVAQDSDVAVTVVGLQSTDDANASALGDDSGVDDEIELWLEIPRSS